MTKQMSRIQSFVASIVDKEFSEKQQVLVLSSDLEVIGGKNGTCENASTISCGGSNKRCIIHIAGCSDQNGRCNTGLKPLDPDRQ